MSTFRFQLFVAFAIAALMVVHLTGPFPWWNQIVWAVLGSALVLGKLGIALMLWRRDENARWAVWKGSL